MSGLAVVLGADRSAHDAYIQIAGAGQRISAAKLHWAMNQGVRLHQSLLRCVHAFLIQAAHGARQWPQQQRGTPRAVAADG